MHTKPEPKTSSEKRVGEIFTGRRKNAVARVKMVKGSGIITVNKKPLEEFFKKPADVRKVRQPLELTGFTKTYDIKINVHGGGNTGQAEAARMGISRSLDEASPEHHKQLRDAGFLTRDSRMVERKKYGLHKARRASQFSKR
ncbi:MAG: 30S ribosomal protein S9 [Leptospirales bacterium]